MQWKSKEARMVQRLSSLEMNSAIRVQIPNEAFCTPHNAIAFLISVNPTILPSTIGK